MSDREQLELAAKASGVNLISKMLTAFGGGEIEEYFNQFDDGRVGCWNPLTDDGDALRLAVKLRLRIECNEASVVASWVDDSYESKEVYVYPDSTHDEDFNLVHVNHDKATRRAIVRAAAEISRQMQEGGAA